MQRPQKWCTRPFVHVLLPIYTYLEVGESMYTPGAQVSKSKHPAAKMCTQGAECTFNFEHWIIIVQQYIIAIPKGYVRP